MQIKDYINHYVHKPDFFLETIIYSKICKQRRQYQTFPTNVQIQKSKNSQNVTSFTQAFLAVVISKTLCRNPTLAKCGDETHTPKVGDLESTGTPEFLEFDSKAQNTSHWGVLGVIRKVLKRICLKWPRISHLDIYSSSYGQKKGRESNWQLDSRPLKVRNRPFPDIRFENATHRWKALEEGYNFVSILVVIGFCSWELWPPKVPGLQPKQFRDNFGTPTWESREKEPFRCSLRRELQKNTI